MFAITLISCLFLRPGYADGKHIKKRKIKKLFKHSVILNNHFTGFALYDIDEKKMIYELNADGVRRDFLSNTFVYPASAPPKKFRQEIPWIKAVH